MNVQQHVMLPQQSAQHVADQVFVAGWDRALAQVAIEIAVAGAGALAVGLGVGDRHEADLAAADRDPARPAIGNRAVDGFWPAGLVAVHGAGHGEFWAGLQSGEAHRLQRRDVSGFVDIRRRHD